jgi:hypothetical protein
MSKLSLRAAFTLGLQSTLAAQQVFADRVTEITAFDASLESLQRSLSVAELSPVIDRSVPRTNFLVYYGVGGIGKTAFSQELENRFISHGHNGTNRTRAAIRFDFAEAAAFDIESYILRLRAGLGASSSRRPRRLMLRSVVMSRRLFPLPAFWWKSPRPPTLPMRGVCWARSAISSLSRWHITCPFPLKWPGPWKWRRLGRTVSALPWRSRRRSPTRTRTNRNRQGRDSVAVGLRLHDLLLADL